MYISHIHLSKANNDLHTATVHEFYKDSFSALYGIKKNSIIYQHDSNIEWLVTPINKTVAELGQNKIPKYFFDVRTTEDFSSPAPEYLLLHKVGLKNTCPLCVKGMGVISLIMAFQLANLYLTKKETALFCLVEQYNYYDDKKNIDGYCASFSVSMTEGDFQIVEYGICNSEKEINDIIHKTVYDDVIIEDQVNKLNIQSEMSSPFLTGIWELIRKKSDCEIYNSLFVCKSSNLFGYIIVSKGE